MRSSVFVILVSVGFLAACQPSRLNDGAPLRPDLAPTFETETILGIPHTKPSGCITKAQCHVDTTPAAALDLSQFDQESQQLISAWEAQQSSIFLYSVSSLVEANILVLKRTLHCIKPRTLWEREGFIMENDSSLFNLTGTETIRARFSSVRYQFPAAKSGLKAQKIEERWSLVSFNPDKVLAQSAPIGDMRDQVGTKVFPPQPFASRWCTGEEMEKALQTK